MNRNFLTGVLCFALLFLTSACSKPGEPILVENETSAFKNYTISRGQHTSEQSTYISTEYAELRFVVKFDSSAIYSTLSAENQYDINKLYGFADNESHHHEFSARIGWRWSDGALRLFGYTYNKGVLSYQELTTISIGSEHKCGIKIEGDKYLFSVNGIITTMVRQSTGATAKGYKLYPYFGGDESAPHDIRIWINEK